MFGSTAAMLAAGSGVARVDADLLAAYAVAVVDLRDADKALAVADRYYQGQGGAWCAHPAVRDRRQAMAIIASLSTALGIGATARKRNNAPAAAPKERVDPLAKYRHTNE